MTPATSSMVLAACDAYRKWVNRVAYVEAMRRAVEAALGAAPASPAEASDEVPGNTSEPDWKSLALKFEAERDEARSEGYEAGTAAQADYLKDARAYQRIAEERAEAAEALALKYQEHLRVAVEALEGAHAKVRVAEDMMRDKGWWENAAKYPTDVAVWLDRAMSQIGSVLTAVRGEEGNSSSVAGLPSSQEGSDTQDIRQAGRED